MFKGIDQSAWLSRLIERMSTLLARQRGLPVLIGIVFVVLSLFIQTLNIYVQSNWLELVGIILIHMGVLTGLVGLLLAEALGR